ncbi:dihydropteroate synthase [Roseateles amylovorans]|uniref:Dihydropteroate synthase n=1 Tax=Roseateles amylovorans TaxID=2978473 RepID=A0ABY6AYQ9_9BURK|nr:dihydropteroate synthase [Roseateles amylovorans]UXH76443.1 dihydropteroate synthase [Roseateles amylovorans]
MSASQIWTTTRFDLDLAERPLVMGIVNVTPDSFSDGGQHNDAVRAINFCERLLGEGVDILDLGGESTRPGAPKVTAEEEWKRLEPVVRAALSLGIPVSVDTCKAEVMRRALDLGVDIINDVQALRDAGAEALVAAHGSVGLCLMHMRGDPASMQQQTQYTDVVDEVRDFLQARLNRMLSLGVARQRITLDPGYGFAKTVEQNTELQRRQHELLALGCPLLVGWSRKSTLGALTGRAVDERLPASLSAALASVARGARVVRVHDVAATVDALKVWQAFGGPLNTGA